VSREAESEVGQMFYIYILQLKDKSFYIGYSSDLKTRIKIHKEGSVESTKNLRPIKLIYYSAFSTQKKATDFEKYLKSSSGFAFRNKRLI
jgi:putative endonuclease